MIQPKFLDDGLPCVVSA